MGNGTEDSTESNVIVVDNGDTKGVKEEKIEEPVKTEIKKEKKVEVKTEAKEKKPLKLTFFKNIYDQHYKLLLLIPLTILILSLLQIGFQTMRTGDFINKGVSLKGGITITVSYDQDVDIFSLEKELMAQFPNQDVSVRRLESTGQPIGVTVTADLDVNDKEKVDALLNSIRNHLNIKLTTDTYSIEFIGSSLGASFFNETFKALIIAFLSMSIVVFLYFSEHFISKIVATTLAVIIALLLIYTNHLLFWILAIVLAVGLIWIFLLYSVPSIAVMLAGFSTMTMTVAVVNIVGIKMSTASIAALLMLIGYSVDTDILLSTRVLKRKEGTIFERTVGAMKTGLVMTLTTLAAVTIALIFTQSEVLQQIMLILFIGLWFDIINTWIQNAGILRWYLEKHEPKN